VNGWRDLIPEEDRELFAAAGFGAQPQRRGERPALLVIDVTRSFVGSPGLTRVEAAAEYRTSCGPSAWAAVPVLRRTITAARAADVPVIYTHGQTATRSSDLGRWRDKNTRTAEDLEKGDELHHIVDEIAPQPEDLVLAKRKPSAFSGTSLVADLVERGIDSVYVTGATTSGCVRATVVDAFSLNYLVTVVEDAVFDRGDLSHAVNLFDMQAKYADVVSADEAIRRLSGAT
jgi:maleamate amidohydrolase